MGKSALKMDKHTQILMVTYYRSLGMTPSDIREVMGISEPTVARRISDAKDLRYLRELLVPSIPEEYYDTVYSHATNYPQAQRFLRIFGEGILKQVIIVPEKLSSQSQESKLRLLGRAAIIHLASILRNGHIVGVSFGRTIREMARAGGELFDSSDRSVKADFVPLIGGLSVLPQSQSVVPPILHFFECSASVLAANLARTFKGYAADQLFLPAPAFVPRAFLKGTDEQIEDRIRIAQEFIESIPEYREVFGRIGISEERDKDSLISKMDIMLTSVGGPLGTGWLGQSGPIISKDEIAALKKAEVVGDICGHFITRKQVYGFPDGHIIAKVNRRVFGPTPLDFMWCARRAADMPREKRVPGVVMVASSAEKAASVLSAVQNECVSTLIIDKELADEMQRLETRLNNV